MRKDIQNDGLCGDKNRLIFQFFLKATPKKPENCRFLPMVGTREWKKWRFKTMP